MEKEAKDYLEELSRDSKERFRQRQEILSFGAYLQRLMDEPLRMTRNAATFMKDTFEYFGERQSANAEQNGSELGRFQLFDRDTATTNPIIGGELVQGEIYNVLDSFSRIGFANKLILMHGPNGSSKTSTVEAICAAMADYSATDEGAVYRFSWIFPADQAASLKSRGEVGPIGFGGVEQAEKMNMETYAYLEENKISSKIHSEFKDHPFYLIPMPQREKWLKEAFSRKLGVAVEEVNLPPHCLISGLSKKNQLILENLLRAYDGDLSRAYRHVQVERFYYSRQYRVGIASVEPQMTIDAVEKQLTMDSNIQNLPSVLHNIRFHEAQGPLVEANRGLLEFSDMLKRPVETFKYLLTTVEKEVIDLPSSTAHLDIVFFATTNEKHLDAFKTSPDFTSFRSRFELVTVPYLLNADHEAQIYKKDIEHISKKKKVLRHSLDLLCRWAVMTRLKQPDPESYPKEVRTLVTKLDPEAKLAMYENKSLRRFFSAKEESKLKSIRSSVMNESRGVVVYEGRFGASPREVRGVLQRAIQNPKFSSLSPLAIFDELERLVKDRTVYEFLQYEPRGKYHDAKEFINVIKALFAEIFESELLKSMTLVEEEQYDILLERYIENVVAYVKNEKVYNSAIRGYEEPSKSVMEQVEKILGLSGDSERHRQGILGKIAAYKIDNKSKEIDTSVIFEDYFRKLEKHYYEEKNQMIEDNLKAMLKLKEQASSLSGSEQKLAETTFENLEARFGYDEESAMDCLRFLMRHRAKK